MDLLRMVAIGNELFRIREELNDAHDSYLENKDHVRAGRVEMVVDAIESAMEELDILASFKA